MSIAFVEKPDHRQQQQIIFIYLHACVTLLQAQEMKEKRAISTCEKAREP